MKPISIPSSSAYISDKGLLIMSANSYFSKMWLISEPRLYLLPDMNIEERIELAEFCGKRNALLQMTRNATFLGLDNRLMTSDNLKTWRTALETENQENMFWHMAETSDGTLFVQEYGSLLTRIYRSTDDGVTWRGIVTSKEIDKRARHFHNIAYDRYRDLLIVTLGDGNLVKIAVSEDFGDSWKPLYTSAYQCLPIVVSKNYVVFGMDSAISRGVIIWDPERNKWQVIHLKYVGKLGMIDSMQSSDLKLFSNGIWIMSTGGGSILSSDDLGSWSMLHLGQKEQFESHMISNEKNGVVAVALGENAVTIDLKTLDHACQHADVEQYAAFFARIKSLAHAARQFPTRVHRSDCC